MARGDRELHCLERIIDDVFPDGRDFGAGVVNTSLLHSSVYGFAQDDWDTLCEDLASAKPNADPSSFPDFISGDTVLEHFEITATIEGRKGSQFKRKHEPFMGSMRKGLGNLSVEDNPRAISRAFPYPNQQHVSLLDSLERNLSKHAESLRAFRVKHAISKAIFVIEHREYGLAMIEDVFGEIGSGRIFGDMREQQKFSSYRMSRDADALSILADYAAEIDVVVFVGVENIEFIKVAEIPDMLKLMPWPFVIAAGPTVELHTFLPVTRVCAPEKEGVDYEQS
ncbi:MAG: hypothetical protein Q4C41_01060 [Eggerthellaceae bacterium]|nr:hypothetical protein [Eggerthellaceae bacterium]